MCLSVAGPVIICMVSSAFSAFSLRTCFAGKRDNFTLDNDPQSLSHQAAWLAYCMAEHQNPKSLHGPCPWQLPIPVVWRKAYLCALTWQHSLLVCSQPMGFLLLQTTVSQSESGLFNRSDLVFLQLSAPTIQRKINGMRCEEAETGKVSLSPCECTVSQIANNQLYHYTRPIFT